MGCVQCQETGPIFSSGSCAVHLVPGGSILRVTPMGFWEILAIVWVSSKVNRLLGNTLHY